MEGLEGALRRRLYSVSSRRDSEVRKDWELQMGVLCNERDMESERMERTPESYNLKLGAAVG